MKTIEALREDLGAAMRNARGVEAVLAAARDEAVGPAAALERASAKHAAAAAKHKAAESEVVAAQGSEISLRALDAAASLLHGLSLVTNDAHRRNAEASTAVIVAEQAHARAVRTTADIEREIRIHPATIEAATSDACGRFLQAARELGRAWLEIDSETCAARVAAVGNPYAWSSSRPDGVLSFFPLLRMLASEGRVPGDYVFQQVRYACEPKETGNKGFGPSLIEATHLALLLRDLLEGPTSRPDQVEAFQRELDRLACFYTFGAAEAAREEEARARGVVQAQATQAEAARTADERARQIAAGEWRPAPMPANWTPGRFVDGAFVPSVTETVAPSSRLVRAIDAVDRFVRGPAPALPAAQQLAASSSALTPSAISEAIDRLVTVPPESIPHIGPLTRPST